VLRLGLRTILVGALLVATACGGATANEDGRIEVVASAYPLAWAAERAGGEAVHVTNLTPPGVEPHDLELSPEDLEAISSADVVLTIGGGFQPAVEEAVAAEASGTVVDVAPVDGDPHVWLDPAGFADVVGRIADALGAAGVADATGNATTVEEDLATLDDDLRAGLAECDSRLLLVNHAAFGRLAAAVDLTQASISGTAPEAEPDPARIAALAELARGEGATTVFTEPLAPPDVAETLAAEAGLTTAVLDPVEGPSDEQLAAGEDYLSIMRTNLETLRDGLGCR